jgi:membrane protein implicated in regulation of membrane protease activity
MPYVPTNPGGGSGLDDCETDREWYWKLIFYTVLFTAMMAGATAYGGSWRAAIVFLSAGVLVVLFLRRCIKKEERKEAQLEDASSLVEKRP